MLICVQYQFCVDGVWRHDEQQPFINGFTDTVNTISVAEPYMLHGMPSRSHMQLDSINFTRHMVCFFSLPIYAPLVCCIYFAWKGFLSVLYI